MKNKTPIKERASYLCTRPSLASHLITAGFFAKRTANPFTPNRMAWVFDAKQNDMAAIDHIVTDYYTNLNKGGKA